MSDPRLIAAALVEAGWRPYNGMPEPSVYEKLNCPHAGAKSKTKRPLWFTRGDRFLCIGCRRACSLHRPKGFPPPLPILYPQSGDPFSYTPQELVTRRHTLNVKETAYCLNVSERKVYTMVAEGDLVALRENPVRIRAEDVKAKMEDFDE
ncbi:MAG: DNA-binding protein [Opitutae bacterium]|nr:DNA-binding protein [Opitutae bacterium]